jgi:putative phosphoesterase
VPGAVKLAIISDTHMPKGPRKLPGACIDRLRQADLIVHAGDLSTLTVLRELERYGTVVAVHGNVDDADVRRTLPVERVIHVPGARVGVIHDAGPARGRLERMRRRFPDCAGVIFGHSHIPLHEAGAGGFQIFNPGSPTERRRAPARTMGLATCEDGRIAFRLVELD